MPIPNECNNTNSSATIWALQQTYLINALQARGPGTFGPEATEISARSVIKKRGLVRQKQRELSKVSNRNDLCESISRGLCSAEKG